jgi:membrane associated rhomboid family serine protease
MFPLRDEIPSRRAPLVTWTLIAANVAIFLWQLTLPAAGVEQLFYLFGIVPARFTDPAWAAQLGFPGTGILPFVTSMFLHGGLLHLLSNMWTLWIFGDNVEDRMGRFRFVVFYLVCGLAAGWVHWFSNPTSTMPTVGASGAIAGVLAAYLRWYPSAKVLTLVPIVFYPLFVDIPAVVFLGIWFVSQLFSGAVSLGAADGVGGIAWWAHVGGFVAGLLLCNLLARRPPEQLPGPRRHIVLPHVHLRGRLVDARADRGRLDWP